MTSEQLKDFVVKLLDEKKATNIHVIDVRGKSALTDFMVIASGTSSRQVSSLAEILQTSLHKEKIRALSLEGRSEGEWVLMDLNDVIVHLFKPEIRDHYNLETLWAEGEKSISAQRGLPSTLTP
ncbi:MAG: ribosome silencing factor [Alphaproteobacteria bacterium 16-39-46]|nr:MAG: ribosome silencing factor [Alphaproteobacteria bacterium 16-39-46]OZA43637.1 MAG: ribosome silencing factor [Alphaproteobacteria bacterium 17-39-52]